ncbi:MAG: hypothetical protein KJN63_11495, partial [Acidimicrobiia bacterium]|nr:hypothetical protein [Acidimicrobiia bacterium]
GLSRGPAGNCGPSSTREKTRQEQVVVMADDLNRLMDAIDGEGPSPEFVATLRERIVAETATNTPPVDDVIVELDLQAQTEEHVSTPARWALVGIAAAAIAVIVSYAALNGSGRNGELDTITPAEVSTTTVTTTAAPPEPAAFEAEATRVIEEFIPLDPGTYRVDTVGTHFSFTIDETLRVQPNSRAYITMSHPGSQGFGDRSITFMRLTALSNPAEPTAPLDELGDGWPADDFAGWLDNLSDEIVITTRKDTTLGGLDAVRVELSLNESGCPPRPDPCGPFGTNRLVHTSELYSGDEYQIWIVEQGNEDPLAVIVAIDREEESEWFDTAEAILSTLAFGDVAPNPILDLPPGPVELPFLGGIQIELPEGAFAIRDPQSFDRIVPYSWPGDTKFLISPAGAAGNPLDTSDDLVAVLRGSADVDEIALATIDGIEARVFNITGTTSSAPTFQLSPGEKTGWHPPPQGRVWVIDHPDRGLLMITAEAAENLDIVLPIALAQTEAIIESLEFVDLG